MCCVKKILLAIMLTFILFNCPAAIAAQAPEDAELQSLALPTSRTINNTESQSQSTNQPISQQNTQFSSNQAVDSNTTTNGGVSANSTGGVQHVTQDQFTQRIGGIFDKIFNLIKAVAVKITVLGMIMGAVLGILFKEFRPMIGWSLFFLLVVTWGKQFAEYIMTL